MKEEFIMSLVLGHFTNHIPNSWYNQESLTMGLLKSAGTRMASFFYSIHQLLRQRLALLATVHVTVLNSVDLTAHICKAVIDIENELLWKALYLLI